jgi:tripartite-type tricarboxylate transporter receptor subunit TctC
MEMLQTATGVKMTHVPYKGAGPGIADLISGQVQVMTNAIPELFPFAKGGRLRVIGIMDDKRHSFMPDVPTFNEQGIKGFVMGNWAGIVAPAGTPAALRSRLAQEVTRILQSPETRKRLEEQGFGPMGGTPEEFGKLIRAEVVRFGAAVKASGATAY